MYLTAKCQDFLMLLSRGRNVHLKMETILVIDGYYAMFIVFRGLADQGGEAQRFFL